VDCHCFDANPDQNPDLESRIRISIKTMPIHNTAVNFARHWKGKYVTNVKCHVLERKWTWIATVKE
jgi:hypothetical protein